MRQQMQVEKVKEALAKGAEQVCYIDIRSPDEYSKGHVPGATCMPLDQLPHNLGLIPKDKLIIVGCQGGVRSEKGSELLRKNGFTNVVELQGGYLAWANAGLPVERVEHRTIPIMQQVLLTAGLLVFFGTLLGIFWNHKILLVPLAIGAGLTFAGATGWCGLAFILGKMPWNRNP